MKKTIKIIPVVLATIFALSLSFTVNAEDMKLEEAKAEISRLEMENKSLQEELDVYEKKIAEHKQRLAEYDDIDMTTGLKKSESE